MKKAKMPKVIRTSAGLRGALFDELDALRAGQSTPHKANATANLARGMIELVRTEIDVRRLLGEQAPATPLIIGCSIDMS